MRKIVEEIKELINPDRSGGVSRVELEKAYKLLNEISIEIETERRSSDWIAFVKGSRSMWEAGASEEEAVWKLRVSLALAP